MIALLSYLNPLAWPAGVQWGVVGAALLALSFYAPFGARFLRMVGVAFLCLGAAYHKGQADCAAKHDLVALRAENAVLTGRLQTLENLSQADAVRALEDNKAIDELRKKIDETPANAGACLDIDTVRRLRGAR